MQLHIYTPKLPLRFPVKTAHSIMTNRPTIAIKLVTDFGVFWSEAPGFESGTYMPETHQILLDRWLGCASDVLTAFKQNQVPAYLANLSHSPIFKYSVDCLYVQWLAATQGSSVYDYLNCKERQVDGAAMLGIQASVDAYMDRILAIKKAGYTGLKLKITPDTVAMVCHVIQAIEFDYISVDANGSFDKDSVQLLADLPNYVVIEQPLPPKEHQEFLRLIHQLPHQFLVDESVRSLDDINAFSGLGIGIMLKPVCMGGIHSTLHAIKRCNEQMIPCGISGYMDSGIGRYFQWCFTQMPQVSLRPDFVWSDYYFESDIYHVKPGITGDDYIDSSLSQTVLSVE